MKQILSTALAAVLALTLLASCSKTECPLTVAELLDLGEKYLLDMDYEQALVQYLAVIEIEPRNERGYTGAAEAYIGLGEIDNARNILWQGLRELPDNTTIATRMSETATAAEAQMPTPTPTPTPSPTPELSPEHWLELYKPIIKEQSVDEASFAIYDIDNSGVPELLLCVNSYAFPHLWNLYTVNNGSVEKLLEGIMCNFNFYDAGNGTIICEAWDRTGSVTTIFTLTGTRIVDKTTLYSVDPEVWDWAAMNNIEATYEINGEAVTKEAYDALLQYYSVVADDYIELTYMTAGELSQWQ